MFSFNLIRRVLMFKNNICLQYKCQKPVLSARS